MNINSCYDFSLDDYNFTISINWAFNLLYLRQYLASDCLYIDADIYLNLVNASYLLGSEQDYGCVLHLLASMLETSDRVLFNYQGVTVCKKSDLLMINSDYFPTMIINIDCEEQQIINNLIATIHRDFITMANNIDSLLIFIPEG